MFVVSAPLDTRLLLCGLIQPHAIKQKSHGMQRCGGALPSGLRIAEQAHRKAAQTPHRPRGSQVNASICSVLTLPWLEFQHPGGAFPSSTLCFHPVVHPSHAHAGPPLQRAQLCTPVPAQVGPLKPKPASMTEGTDRKVRDQSSKDPPAPPPLA